MTTGTRGNDSAAYHRQPRGGEDERRSTAGGIRCSADGNSAIRLFQRWRIVHAVAGHCHEMTPGLQRLDDSVLVFREYPGESVSSFDGIDDR